MNASIMNIGNQYNLWKLYNFLILKVIIFLLKYNFHIRFHIDIYILQLMSHYINLSSMYQMAFERIESFACFFIAFEQNGFLAYVLCVLPLRNVILLLNLRDRKLNYQQMLLYSIKDTYWKNSFFYYSITSFICACVSHTLQINLLS